MVYLLFFEGFLLSGPVPFALFAFFCFSRSFFGFGWHDGWTACRLTLWLVAGPPGLCGDWLSGYAARPAWPGLADWPAWVALSPSVPFSHVCSNLARLTAWPAAYMPGTRPSSPVAYPYIII